VPDRLYAPRRIPVNTGAAGILGSGDDILVYINPPGNLIREHRQELGLSQRSLARRAGMTQAAISRLERGLTAPNWETLRALMLAMGYEPQLHARRLRGRWDPVHLAATRRRSPAERLELAISANRLAGRLRQAGGDAAGGS
jgi:transcriptional regulator with XRE-family HTH domain